MSWVLFNHFFFRMALSKIDHEFVNNLLYIEGVKFHRGRFYKDSFVQQWDCSYCKKRCPCHATTKLGIMNDLMKSFTGTLNIICK